MCSGVLAFFKKELAPKQTNLGCVGLRGLGVFIGHWAEGGFGLELRSACFSSDV